MDEEEARRGIEAAIHRHNELSHLLGHEVRNLTTMIMVSITHLARRAARSESGGIAGLPIALNWIEAVAEALTANADALEWAIRADAENR